jgi:hypothetical protein
MRVPRMAREHGGWLYTDYHGPAAREREIGAEEARCFYFQTALLLGEHEFLDDILMVKVS